MLTVQPLDDVQAITDLYRAPEFTGLAHDHRPVAPVFHPSASYLGAYVHGALAGLFLFVKTSAIEVDLHVLILRRYVLDGRALGRLCLDYVFKHLTIQRATAYVTEGLESARNYCLKLGFRCEGFRRDACLREGRLLGVYTMGMTRRDWGVL